MKSRLSVFSLYLLLSALILNGCTTVKIGVGGPGADSNTESRDAIQGSGNLVTEDRPVKHFNHVSLIGVGDVIITQGDEESLTVKADDNLMPYIKTEVENGTLVLDFIDKVKHKNIKPSRPIQYHLSLRTLTGLNVVGVGNINASPLDTDRLDILLTGVGNVTLSSLVTDHLEIILTGVGDIDIDALATQGLAIHLNGTGSVELAGQAEEQSVFLNGMGDYRAAELESRTTSVEVNGVGNAAVWATETLDVRITGPSTVEYYGDPQVTQNISIVGRLVRRDNR